MRIEKWEYSQWDKNKIDWSQNIINVAFLSGDLVFPQKGNKNFFLETKLGAQDFVELFGVFGLIIILFKINGPIYPIRDYRTYICSYKLRYIVRIKVTYS